METKTCTRCKIEKSRSEFHKDTSRGDGLQCGCKECRREYQQKYRKTERGKATQRRGNKKYYQTESSKDTHRTALRKYRLLYPERIKARRVVNNAIRSGRLIRPSHCESCMKKRFAESHHEDYSKPLDVDWLCNECHNKLRGLK